MTSGVTRGLVQDGLLNSLPDQDKFKAGSDLATRMRTILRHTFIDRYRRLRYTGQVAAHMRTPIGTIIGRVHQVQRMLSGSVQQGW